ncbi:TonB-dependent receptor [Sulfurovum sp. zt1-1]|uniref:TonB-dependent receptor n=1 Tax=Sulfurovum zhangzhouensis TaxID=3019067 RepID=A0ABT7QX99_9BACT|nr:TonB-dependent receptor [Sulfurovum zhangzhouensis]MDM5271452.1 TonB-dependent receptor [Sulfurovum zhangzhouensis]
MKKVVGLSLLTAMALQAAPVELDEIEVEGKVDTEVIKDVSGEEIKSADLADALFKTSPSVALVRRSGISNDIIVRGMKKDNINVLIDGAKVCGACPNRMDPPISHIATNNVDYIEINEGPFNVEDFGNLGADVKISTLKPSKEFTGEVGLNLGSWDYKKGYFNVSGGVENVRFLLSASTERGGQYEDGDGNTFAEQQDNYIADHATAGGMAYLPSQRDMDAFSKKTMMAKLFWDIAENQELRLGYTANRSDNILYPNTPMDAIYDDSDIYTAEYIAKDLGEYSKKLSLNLYQTEVDHPMSNEYRKSSMMMGVMTHALTTKVQGAKLKNEFELGNHALAVGLDYSLRNWDGKYYMNDMPLSSQYNSIWDVDTENAGIFIKDKMTVDQFEIDMGLRYDNTEITTADTNTSVPDRSYNSISGNILATYHANETTKYFVGAGIGNRVPDGRELYYYDKSGLRIGNFDLKKVTNNEIDMGLEKKYENAVVKAKFFYSYLKNFIAYNSVQKTFDNIDARIWGFDLSGTYFATESLSFDIGMSKQNGKKLDAGNIVGQEDQDLPEIPPFKMNLAVNYEVDPSLLLNAEVIASDAWVHYDAINGEQKLDAYGVLNLKGTKTFGNNVELTVGVDNVFGSTYATSNTYRDLTLIYGGGDVMLLNEPGRYFYTNLKYKF